MVQGQVPTDIRESEWKTPKALSIHRTTAMIATPFTIDLMVRCMGMKRFMSQSRTPIATTTSKTWIKGIV